MLSLPTFVRTRSVSYWVCLGLMLVTTSSLIAAGGKRVVRKPTFDASAESVDLFAGVDQGTLDATLIPKSSLEGNLLIENKSKKPLTVRMPKAFAAVQVLKQGFGVGGPGGGAGGIGQQGGGFGGGQGGGQAVGGGGGGFGGGGQGGGGFGGGGQGGGGGFFSIPPESTVQLPIHSLCLEHGKAEPRTKMIYKLVPLETYTKDPVLQELITNYASGRVDQEAAQAAVWHVANGMSWQELSAKSISSLGGMPPKPYFQPGKLALAQSLVYQASAEVREREKKNPSAATIEKKL